MDATNGARQPASPPGGRWRGLLVQLFLRWSVRRGVFAITVASVLLSLVLTVALAVSLFGTDRVMILRSILIAGVVSVIVAPIMSYSILKLVHELEIARAQVHTAAITDSLTGVHNRRFFMESGERMMTDARSPGASLVVIIFDIDDFKSINDHHGHAAGDAVLKRVGEIALHCLRGDDVLARIGGEEFAVLLPGVRLAEGVEVAERVRLAIVEHPFALADGTAPIVSVSLGVAAIDRQARFDELLQAADGALYRAKAAGKNRSSAA